MKKVAVTGGLSSGKSAACRIFQETGAYVVDSDAIVHDLLENDEEIINKVTALLGPDILMGKRIDRNAVAKKVFSDPQKLRLLEEILHPIVIEKIREEEKKARKRNSPLFVVEVPLIEKDRFRDLFDIVICIDAGTETRKQRYKKDDFYQRDKFQSSQEEKKARADFVIKNESAINDLIQQINLLKEHLF